MPSSLNVASHLARMAHEHPKQVAIHAPRGRVNPNGPTDHLAITFAELHADSDAIAHGLARREHHPRHANRAHGAAVAGLLRAHVRAVQGRRGAGAHRPRHGRRRNLGRCLAEAEPEAFVGIAKAHAPRRLLGWARKTVRTTVNVGRWRFFCHTSLARLRERGRKRGPWTIPDAGATEPAAILFTSGSTGPAKGVVYTHGIFAAQVEMLKATYGIEPGEIDLCTFPLFALFGPALGMTCVIPDMDATRPAQLDPHKAAAQIRQFGVTNTVRLARGDPATGGAGSRRTYPRPPP